MALEKKNKLIEVNDIANELKSLSDLIQPPAKPTLINKSNKLYIQNNDTRTVTFYIGHFSDVSSSNYFQSGTIEGLSTEYMPASDGGPISPEETYYVIGYIGQLVCPVVSSISFAF